MTAPKIVIPTQTPLEKLRPKGYGRWPNKSQQTAAKAAGK